MSINRGIDKDNVVHVYNGILCVCAQSLSCVRLFAIPWTIALQAPLFMGFSRLEYRSGLPFPSPGDLPDSGIEPVPPELGAAAAKSLQ